MLLHEQAAGAVLALTLGLVRPSDVPVHRGAAFGALPSVFQKAEAEAVAVWIVRMLAERGDAWRSFARIEFVSWLKATTDADRVRELSNPFLDLATGFARLIEQGFLAPDGATIALTDAFILRVYLGALGCLS